MDEQLPQPEQQVQAGEPTTSPSQQEEYLVAQWTEAEHTSSPFAPHIRLRLIMGAITLCVSFIGLGIWLGQLNFYFAAVVVLAGLAAVFQQNKHGETPLEVVVTTARVQIGKRIVALNNLTGFWLQDDSDLLVIYFESKRPSVVPISCFYRSNDREEVRTTLLQVLPELEPRNKHFTDRFSNYFKF